MSERRTQGPGVVTAVHGVLLVLYVLAIGGMGGALQWLLARMSAIGPEVPQAGFILTAAPAGLLGLGLVLLGTAVGVLLRARRMPTGTRGRVRLLLLSVATIVQVLTLQAAGGITAWAAMRAEATGLLVAFDVTELLIAMTPILEGVFWLLVAVAGLSLLLAVGAVVGAWFLVAQRTRARIWMVVDVVLLAAFVLVSITLPIAPPKDAPEAVLLPSIRLAVTTLFGARALAWIVPPLLDAVEGLGFRPLVASRHLRARKSSFLAAISMLSVLAVGFSSCSLTTTLSVMGGFRQDLKSKILGNNAHVRIDREDGSIEGWASVLEKARSVEGVEAASPYAGGEVMVTSTSNIAGAVLRGVDPQTIDEVTDLEQNMVRPEGSLEYLVDPEKLLDVPAEVMGPLPLHAPTGGDEPERDRGSPVRDVDELVGPGPDGGAGAPDGGAPEQAPGEADAAEPPSDDPFLDRHEDDSKEVLPGIVVGKELARTLRLTVGDEVNVVSPFGDLGPSGPMPKSRPYRVAGIFYSGMYEYDMKYTYVRLHDAQRFLAIGDAISGIEIKVDDIDAAPTIAARIEDAIGRDDLRVRDWQELNRNLFGALALEKLAMFITLGIAVLVAGFCVFGTLTLMVQEKGREVAILKAMGTPRRSIVAVFLFEGLLIGVFGAVIGLGLGFLVCYLVGNFNVVPIDPEVYYINNLPVHIDPVEFTLVGVSAAVVCLLATVFPAVLASRMRPVDALRYE